MTSKDEPFIPATVADLAIQIERCQNVLAAERDSLAAAREAVSHRETELANLKVQFTRACAPMLDSSECHRAGR